MDFARVHGLPGTYVANQLDLALMEDPKFLDRKTGYEDYIKTKITFNKVRVLGF